jgi:uncharacterized protein DUF1707
MLEGMGRDEMRAADADRQVVADRLKTALDEGRLDLHEYDERLQQAYTAKTYGELEALLTDLPSGSLPAPRAAQSPLVADGANPTRVWLFETWGSWAPVAGITTAIWFVSSINSPTFQYFWPIWVIAPWGLMLVWATIHGLATGEPQKKALERARKAEAKQLKRERPAALEAEAAERGEVLPPMADKDKEAG